MPPGGAQPRRALKPPLPFPFAQVVAGQVAVVDVAPGSSAGRLAVVEKSCHVVAALAAQAAVEYSGANA